MSLIFFKYTSQLTEVFSNGIIYVVRTQDFPEVSVNYPLIGGRAFACQGVRNTAFWEELCKYEDDCYYRY